MINSANFRQRAFNRLVRKALGRDRRFTPHGLRHTFASHHLARGSNLMWVQQAGGWSSAKMLLDVYGHFMPTESRGFADALTAPIRPLA
jgi:integrase